MTNQDEVSATTRHPVVSAAQWLTARKSLLEAEKQLTRQSDEVARKRMALPWVKIEKDYVFHTVDGKQPLASLFKGRSQLLVYHFMFGKDYTAGCPHCSAIADGFNGCWPHLADHDVMLWAVSSAPLQQLQAFRKRMGWTFPWASSEDSDFNYDFDVSFTEAQQRSGNVQYNYSEGNVRSNDRKIEKTDKDSAAGEKIAATVGADWPTYSREAPGMSAFALEGGVVYHTYSAYARGLDALWGVYQWLDRAPLGRNENGFWMKRHDEYNGLPGDAGSKSCCQ